MEVSQQAKASKVRGMGVFILIKMESAPKLTRKMLPCDTKLYMTDKKLFRLLKMQEFLPLS